MKKKREENVELADIQAVRERMTQWAIRLWLLLIPVIVGIILSTQGESTARAGNFIVRIAFLLILMGAGYVAYLRNLERNTGQSTSKSTGWTICRLMTCANIWRRREPRWIWGR